MSSEVYEQLREGIVAGEYAAGESLVELSLADRYGTSRTPIREALRRLEQDGLVERGDRGMRVRTRSPEEIMEIYEARITLEATVAAAAAERRTELDLIRIRRAAAAMSEVDTSDAHAMAATNRVVHEAIWAAGHNGTIVDLLTRLNNHLTRYPSTTLSVPGRWAQALRQHEEIIEAIERRDGAAANELSRVHMTQARDIRLKIYSEEAGL